MLGSVGLCAIVPTAGNFAGGFLIWMIIIFFGSAYGLVVMTKREQQTRGVALLERLDADYGEVAVRTVVRLVDASPVLGHDHGALCVEDGWLVFRGVRTEWAVKREDVVVGRSHLGYTAPGGARLVVALDPVEYPAGVRRLLEEWAAAPSPTGASVFPPAIVAPERRRVVTWKDAVVAAGGIGAAFVFFRADAPFRFFLLGSLAAVVVVLIAFRLTDLRALRRAGAWR